MRKVWHINDTKREISPSFIYFKFFGFKIAHTKPAATLHFQNTILSENYTPGQMIAANTPV